MKRRLFVLPVNDVETLAIKEMLERNREDFAVTDQDSDAWWENVDAGIRFKYKDYDVIYGIELQGNTPEKGVNIDHHIYDYGDHEVNRFNELSSIEQVAELLGENLSDGQRLISEHDKRYLKRRLRLH